MELMHFAPPILGHHGSALAFKVMNTPLVDFPTDKNALPDAENSRKSSLIYPLDNYINLFLIQSFYVNLGAVSCLQFLEHLIKN